MSKFDELKANAKACRGLKWEPSGRNAIRTEEGDIVLGMGVDPDDDERMFIAAANPAAVLDLLAIQAQLVEALKLFTDFPQDVLTMPADENYTFTVQGRYFSKACVALAAAGAQP